MRFFAVVLLSTLCLSTTNGLSTFLQNNKQQLSTPIKKVAIIGSGIAGLSLAHALENSDSCAKPYLDALSTKGDTKAASTSAPAYGVETCIYDARSSLNFEAGAGVQINGGARTIQKINPQLYEAVKEASLPLKMIRSRTKPWIGNKDFATLLELNLEKIIKQTGGDVEKELIVNGEVMAYTIMRGALQEVLLEELPSDSSSKINFSKTLIGIENNSQNDGIMCQFQDGTTEGPFDLVIGCDGINSAVKEYIEKGTISNTSAKDKRSSAIYSGIRIQYAVQDGDENDDDVDSAELVQYFGDAAYSLAGVYGAGKGRKPTKGAFLISRDEGYIGPFKRRSNPENDNAVTTKEEEERNKANENSDWTQDNTSLESTMSKCINDCKVPTLQILPIVKESDRFFELGVYFHNPFSLKGWSREVRGSGGRFTVLAGDAAHAMPPFLGQGSNQAIQDAYCLASKVFEHNANCITDKAANTNSVAVGDNNQEEKSLSVRELLKDYEHVRWFPTTSITLKAGFLGYLETGQKGFLSGFRDAFFFFAGKIGLARKIFLDSATPKV